MLTIRQAIESDLDALLDLYDHFDRPDESSAEGVISAWKAMLAQPGLFVYVGEVARQLVTSCTLVVVPNLRGGPRPYGLIELVVTHSGHRRRGHGTAVVKHALAAAWEMNCYKVMLLTGHTDEGTLRFYEGTGLVRGLKTGFVAAAPTHDHGVA